MLRKAKGKEALFEMLETKYGPEPDSDEELDEFLALGKATEEGEEEEDEEDEGDDLQEKMDEDAAVSESYLTSGMACDCAILRVMRAAV